MLRNQAQALAVAVALAVSLNCAFAAQIGAPTSPTSDTTSRDAFWHAGLAHLQDAPPRYRTVGDNGVVFTGGSGRIRSAWCNIPDGRSYGAIVHITDAAQAAPVYGPSSWANFCFAWRQGINAKSLEAVDPREHALYAAIIDACRLTELASACLGAESSMVGLVGEGYGGAIALAVAALMPTRVAFVVAHQPICLTSEALREAVPEDGGAAAPGQLGALGKHLGAMRFAPDVRARTLLSFGTEDPYATPESVTALYDTLTCPKELVTLAGHGHCGTDEVIGWEKFWRSWAFGGSGTP